MTDQRDRVAKVLDRIRRCLTYPVSTEINSKGYDTRTPTPETIAYMVDLLRDADAAIAAMDEPAPVLDNTSLRFQIGEIGNQVHNIGCEVHGNEGLSDRLAYLASRLWAAAQKASSEPAPVSGLSGRPDVWASHMCRELRQAGYMVPYERMMLTMQTVGRALAEGDDT